MVESAAGPLPYNKMGDDKTQTAHQIHTGMQQLLKFDSMSDLLDAALEMPCKRTRLNKMRTKREQIDLDEEEDVKLRKYLVKVIGGLGDFTACLVVEDLIRLGIYIMRMSTRTQL